LLGKSKKKRILIKRIKLQDRGRVIDRGECLNEDGMRSKTES